MAAQFVGYLLARPDVPEGVGKEQAAEGEQAAELWHRLVVSLGVPSASRGLGSLVREEPAERVEKEGCPKDADYLKSLESLSTPRLWEQYRAAAKRS